MSDTTIPHPSALAPNADHAASLTAPAMVGPSWQDQDGVLRDLWMQNKTPQEIAEQLNRSVAAIMTRAARLGLPRRSAPGRKPGSRRLPDDIHRTRQTTARATTRDPAESENFAPQVSSRICLMCLRSFQSQGRHNRICQPCKGSAQYEAATSLADIHFPV